jgi:hypothetical protein
VDAAILLTFKVHQSQPLLADIIAKSPVIKDAGRIAALRASLTYALVQSIAGLCSLLRCMPKSLAAEAKGIPDCFRRALEAQKHADDSVAAGREFVEAYVVFTHYVEQLHASVKGGTEQHGHR